MNTAELIAAFRFRLLLVDDADLDRYQPSPKLGCELAVADLEENPDDGSAGGFDMESYGCFEPEPRHEDFEMEMTLILRFQRPDYAAGMVTFQGEADGYGFGAQAPVTMSRH
jgi:hypothetical protein